MSIKVIVEFTAKPGMRAELLSTLTSLIAEHGSSTPGYLGSKRYEVVDQPDMLLEIAEWESVEARSRHLERARAAGVFAPVLELLAAPFKATVARPLP